MASDQPIFHIEEAADGVYLAIAKTQAFMNANAAIFVNSRDVLVVDTHSKPSAAVALQLQIKREITEKPVRYVVNTHFHDDHVQGNAAYLAGGERVEIIASELTRELMAKETLPRLERTMRYVAAQIERVTGLAQAAGTSEEKEYWKDLVRQFESFQTEMRDFVPVLPSVTFKDSYTIRDKEHDIHVQFHGLAHTAGDVVVYCPQKRVVATGDLISGGIPYMPDCYPKSWAKTIDSIARLDFEKILPAHGPIHHDRRLANFARDLIEELTDVVGKGKSAGESLEELQAAITVESLRSLQEEGTVRRIEASRSQVFPHWGKTYIGPPDSLQGVIANGVRNLYRRIDPT